jgi:hypothetical protein
VRDCPHTLVADAGMVEFVISATGVTSVRAATSADLNLGNNSGCHKGKSRKNGMALHNSGGLFSSRED